MSDVLLGVCMQGIRNGIEKMRNKGIPEDQIIIGINETLQPAIEAMLNEAVKDITTDAKNQMYEYVHYAEAEDAEFLARQEQKWGKCFTASRMMYNIATEAAEMLCEYISELDEEKYSEKQYTFFVLKHLHGRACQEYLEILTLMRAGFADGAYARWRSMYELCCIAEFIKQHGEAIAKQYYEQSETEEQGYSWTNGVVDNKGKTIRTFKQIQDMCMINDVWRSQYKLGCFVNHASPQGTFGRMATGCPSSAIPVGRSDYGLILPAEHSSICLAWISANFLSLFTHADSIAIIYVLNNWMDYIRELYLSTHDIVFQDMIKNGIIEPLWKKEENRQESRMDN